MSLGEYAPLSERKRPCVPRPALFALFGALLWAVVGLTATVATLSAAEVEVTAVEAIVPPGRCDHAQVALNVSYRLRRNMLAEKFRQGFFLPDPVAGAVLRVANASLDDAHGGALLRLAQPFETRLPAAGGEGSIVLRADLVEEAKAAPSSSNFWAATKPPRQPGAWHVDARLGGWAWPPALSSATCSSRCSSTICTSSAVD